MLLVALAIAVVAVGFGAIIPAAAAVVSSASADLPGDVPCNPALPHNGHGPVCATAGNGSFAIPTVFAEAFVSTIRLLFAPWPDDRGRGATPMPRLRPPQLRPLA